MYKTYTTKDSGRNVNQGLIWKYHGIRNFIVHGQRGHSINKITCRQNDITPVKEHWHLATRYEQFQLSVSLLIVDHVLTVAALDWFKS